MRQPPEWSSEGCTAPFAPWPAVGAGRTLVVVPAFNEAASVADVVRGVLAEAPDADVLVVDDGSSDGTAEAARAAGAVVARLPFNLGVGGAMRTGFRFARRGGYAAVVQVDADGQHDPACLGVLLRGLRHADVVVGSRFAAGSGYGVRGPRRWAMRVLASVMSRLLGTRLTDATSGFRAAGPRAIRVYAQHYPAEYLGDTLETLVIGHKSGLVTCEVPVVMHARAAGRPSRGPATSTLDLARAAVVILLGLVRQWPVMWEAEA